MELVQNKEELRALSPDEIFKRLNRVFYDIYIRSSKEQREQTKEMGREEKSLWRAKMTTERIAALTLAEIKSIDMYLSASLAILKNKLLRKQNDLSPSDKSAIVAAFNILVSANVYKRGFQKALMMWIAKRDKVQTGLRPIPFELQDRNIPHSLAQEMGRRFQDELSSIPSLLREVIKEAKSCNDEKILNKASGLLTLVENAFVAHEKDWKSLKGDAKFMVELATLLKKMGTFGKVIVKSDHIELNPNLQDEYPFIQKPHPWWRVKPGKKMVLNGLIPLSVYTKRIAESLGLNSDTQELRPVTSLTEKGCIRIDFIWTTRKDYPFL